MDIGRLGWFILIVGLWMTVMSCRDSFEVDQDILPESQKLYFLSILSPSDTISAHIEVLEAIGNEDLIDKRDIRVEFSGSDAETRITGMPYDPTRERFVLRNRDFRVSPGQSYEIKAWVDSDERYDTIIARTVMPSMNGDIDVLISSPTFNPGSDSLTRVSTTGLITLPEDIDGRMYFNVSPVAVVRTFKLSARGDTLWSNEPARHIPFLLTDTNANAYRQGLESRSGIFIAGTDLSSHTIEMLLELRDPIDLSSQHIERIELELYCHGQELFEYWDNLDIQLRQNNLPYTTPLRAFSNVENGYGVFSSMIKNRYTLKL